MGSEFHTDGQCSVIVERLLAFEFLADDGVGSGYFQALEHERETCASIRDQRPLIDAVTVTKGVAIEKNIAQDPSSLRTGEQIGAPFFGGRLSRGRKFIRNVVPQSQRQAALKIGENIPGAKVDEGNDIS